MKKLLKENSAGFTLIELILTVIAIGIFGSITASILGNASKVYKQTLNKQKFVSEARHSFFRMNRDLNLQKWPTNDNVSSSKSISIKSADGQELQYDIQSDNKLRLNLIRHPDLDPSSKTLSKIVYYPVSNVSYYDNQNNLISDNSESNSISLTKVKILFNNPDHGYSMNLESYNFPHNFKFGKPMDYHD